MMRDFPKFRSLRDKSGSPSRSKPSSRETKASQPPVSPLLSLSQHGDNDWTRRALIYFCLVSQQSRPLLAETVKFIFKPDRSRDAPGAEVTKEEPKVEEVRRLLDRLNITNVSSEHIRDIMGTLYADGDPKKTAAFIDIEQKASAGEIMPYNPNVHLVGAENRHAVTCYLDALLFAMFVKLDAYECMLKNDFPLENPRNKLVHLLRIWVNMVRTGKLVRIDLTKLLQDSLADCGWESARMLQQQDTSEAFGFLTETLNLPLLSLQVDLFHDGKKDDDDHKIVQERLLNLSVPADPDGKGIKLEDCLEEYFNAKVDVLRDYDPGKESGSEGYASDGSSSLVHSSIRIVRGGDSVGSTALTSSPLQMTPLISPESALRRENTPSSHASDLNRSVSHNDAVDTLLRGPRRERSSNSQGSPRSRHRSASLIQRVMLDDKGRPTTPDNGVMAKRARRKGSTVVKAITIPAWQFFKLIPWHSVTNKEPRNNTEVAMTFDRRPVVGICLKRYGATLSGQTHRSNTFIDIPESLRLPHFMLADGPDMQEDANGLRTEYKLVLQSVVCHRGDSMHSGHYIAFARVAPKLLTNNRRHNFDPPPDYEEAQWVKFDDLEVDNRVTVVDDLRKALQAEMPYLLFYQILPMVDGPTSEDAATAAVAAEPEPPSYNESGTSVETPRRGVAQLLPPPSGEIGLLSSATPNRGLDISLGDPFLAAFEQSANRSKPPSIRLSTDNVGSSSSSRRFGDGGQARPGSSNDTAGSRRQSVTFSDSVVSTPTPAITPETHSPVMAPEDEPPQVSRLSRAASRFNLGSRSRPESQSGEGREGREGRLSSTISRFNFMKSSKEPLAEANHGPANGEGAAEARKSTSSSPEERRSQEAVRSASKSKYKKLRSKSDHPDRECGIM